MINKFRENAIAMTYLSYIVTFGSAVFVLPLVLVKFNAVEISIWFLFTTIMGLAALADSGFGATLIRATSYLYSGAKNIPKNLQEFRKIEEKNSSVNISGIIALVQTSNILYLAISVLATILVFSVGSFFVDNLISKSQNQSELWLAFYLLIATVFIRMQSVKWNSFLQGFDKVALQKQIETIFGSIRVSAFLVILFLDMNILQLVIADLLLTLAIFISTKVVVNSLFSKWSIINTNKLKYNKEILTSIFPSAWRYGAMQWGGYLTNFSNSLIVSQLPDPKIIASFFVTQRIIFFTRQLAQVTVYAKLPTVFQMMSKHQFLELKEFTAKAIQIGLAMLIAILIGVGVLGDLILYLISVETRLVSTEVFIIMAISIVLEYHHAAHAQIYMGSNHVPFLFPALISGILILSIGFGVVGIYGLMGIVLTQFFVQLSLNNWYPVYLNLKLLDWNFWDYMKSVLIYKGIK